MNATIDSLLHAIQLGEPAADAGLTLIPVFGEFAGVPKFITLGEAIANGSLVVTEVSEGASVPTLRAHNKGAVGVLVIDGEELVGAKQNRVLNTSVYLKPGAEIVIPVSCTEQGRWTYRSAEFADSGYVAAHAVRHAANESVTENLRSSGDYRSDQSRVWREVDALQSRHALRSPTAAMRDVYEARGESSRRRESAFPCLPGQLGLLALWSGHVVGLDVVGAAEAYARLHARLVRSYALDAPHGAPSLADADRRAAKEWLAKLADVAVTTHESPGDGVSLRFTHGSMAGSALLVDGAVLHAIAFAAERGKAEQDDERRYPGFVERRERFPW